MIRLDIDQADLCRWLSTELNLREDAVHLSADAQGLDLLLEGLTLGNSPFGQLDLTLRLTPARVEEEAILFHFQILPGGVLGTANRFGKILGVSVNDLAFQWLQTRLSGVRGVNLLDAHHLQVTPEVVRQGSLRFSEVQLNPPDGGLLLLKAVHAGTYQICLRLN